MVQRARAGPPPSAAQALDDSFEPMPPENVQDQDRDLTFFYFDVAASGLRATDSEMCAMGVYRDPATGEKREFFGCDVAVVIP